MVCIFQMQLNEFKKFQLLSLLLFKCHGHQFLVNCFYEEQYFQTLKFITKRVVSIFNNVAFFVTICPISAIICHKKHLVTMISAILTKINKIFKKKSYFKNFEIIQVLLIFGKSEQRKSDKNL